MERNQSVPENTEIEKPIGLQLSNKVPQVTIFFWMIEIMATNMGEKAADFFHHSLNLGLTITIIIMIGLFIVTLNFQFRAKKYMPSIYWLVVVFINVLGTVLAEILSNHLRLPLVITTIIFLVILAANFLIWYLSERTLSLYSIYSKKREAFYWLSILFTCALGTSVGNWASQALNLDYIWSALMFAALLRIVAIAYRDHQMKQVPAFWLAYFLTRPFGASLGNFLAKQSGLSTTGISLFFVLITVILIIYLTITGKDKSRILTS